MRGDIHSLHWHCDRFGFVFGQPRSARVPTAISVYIPELYYTSGTSTWLTLCDWFSFSQSEAEDSVWLSGIGECYVQLLSVSHGGRSSVTNVAWGRVY